MMKLVCRFEEARDTLTHYAPSAASLCLGHTVQPSPWLTIAQPIKKDEQTWRQQQAHAPCSRSRDVRGKHFNDSAATAVTDAVPDADDSFVDAPVLPFRVADIHGIEKAME